MVLLDYDEDECKRKLIMNGKDDEEELQRVTFLLSNSPSEDEKVLNSLRLAEKLIPNAKKVNIFLLGEAVTAAKKGVKILEDNYDAEKILSELIKQGVKILVCGPCLNSRGLHKEDLVEGVELGSMEDLVKLAKESSRILRENSDTSEVDFTNLSSL